VADVELELHIEPVEVDGPASEAIFRVAQEALTNVARHAEASQVIVRLGPRDDGFGLEISDDGVGLPAEESDGIGLVGARERVERLGGYLDVEARPEGGVCLTMWLPREE
jgi:signal transduction histidine kinase